MRRLLRVFPGKHKRYRRQHLVLVQIVDEVLQDKLPFRINLLLAQIFRQLMHQAVILIVKDSFGGTNLQRFVVSVVQLLFYRPFGVGERAFVEREPHVVGQRHTAFRRRRQMNFFIRQPDVERLLVLFRFYPQGKLFGFVQRC